MAAQSKPRVAIIGGGCAGLAAAARLAEKGITASLFEASPQLGGRARGLQWKGQRLDNGQHILLGAYSETLRLLKLAGVDQNQALLRLPLQLTMYEQFELSAHGGAPAPLHILLGLLRAKGLSLHERLAAIRLMIWMKLTGFTLAQDETLQNLLSRKTQPARLIKLLWEPLCLAALNTPLKGASAQVFLNVLRDSFAKAKSDSDMLLPRHDLSALLAEPLAAYIKSRDGHIQTNAPVATLHPVNNGFLVQTEDGASTEFTHVIIAVSSFRLPALVSHLPALAEIASLCSQFKHQPIYTIYLQYPTTVKLDMAMTGFAEGYSQWVFDRGSLCGQHGLLAVVVSAEGPHQKLTQENLALAVAKELASAFPQLPAPLWHKVIAEKRATFACSANLQRPLQKTPLPGLYLAGDYTTDGDRANAYPATIEGAVRSGVQCADHVIAQLSV
jgi:squalene-associated FAD-dependent desaturase